MPVLADLPVVGNDEVYEKDRLAALLHWSQQYGGVIRYNESVYFLTEPDLIGQVLARTDEDFIVPDTNPLQGKRLSIEESVPRRRLQRRGQALAFHHNRIESFSRQVVEITTAHMSHWQNGQRIALFEEMKRLFSRLSILYLLGEEGIPLTSLIYQFVDALFAIYNSPFAFPAWLPTPHKRRARTFSQQLHREIAQLIERRQNNAEAYHDVLAMLTQTPLLDGQPVTQEMVFEWLILLLFVSAYAPIAALSWTWFLLAQAPEQESKLCKEVGQVLAGRPAQIADLSHLPYLTGVLKESLRLYPPVWQIARLAARDCELLGYTCAKGQRFHLCSYAVQRNPRFFPEPERFLPERWRDETLLESLPKWSYFPFGGGPHHCLGSALALTALPLIMATIMQRFRFRLINAAEVRIQPQSLLTPANLEVVIESGI
ncbi:MAG TPA: cytochrome P450 [Ktedonobacteraceae bacterium]|nr:cytochrome P450 [Ktedonobacteraceae bacterium]